MHREHFHRQISDEKIVKDYNLENPGLTFQVSKLFDLLVSSKVKYLHSSIYTRLLNSSIHASIHTRIFRFVQVSVRTRMHSRFLHLFAEHNFVKFYLIPIVINIANTVPAVFSSFLISFLLSALFSCLSHPVFLPIEFVQVSHGCQRHRVRSLYSCRNVCCV